MHRYTALLLLLACALGAVPVLAASTPPAPAARPAAASPLTTPVDYPAGIGEAAPDFTLRDTAGQPHHLADYLQQGKIVVLEWFSPACSACEEYYSIKTEGVPSRMERIIASLGSSDVVWLSINSTGPHESGGALAENAAAHNDWRMSAPLLLDPTGAVGRAYDAEYTPTIYVINKDGTLVYAGAPDDEGAGSFPSINFVGRAVAQLRAGQDVTVFSTEPFGCPVDYAPDAASTAGTP